MARYRKTDVRIWVDQKFRRLSPIPPCGQGLFFYLMTNPSTSNVPGLYRSGEAALAEELDWSLEDFRAKFAECEREGMVKADWKARVVWVPNAIKYNEPESLNVVKSWSGPWDEIPDCPLKAEAYVRLLACVEAKGEGFADQFRKSCAKPKAMGDAMSWANQEQEQKQEQEKNGSAAPTRAARIRLPKDFALTEARRGYAMKLGARPVEAQFEAFSDYHRAKGSVMLDWDAAWRTWCRNAVGRFAARRGTPPGEVRVPKREPINGPLGDALGGFGRRVV